MYIQKNVDKFLKKRKIRRAVKLSGRYHISKNGTRELCHAKIKCPLGGFHGSAQEVDAEIERMHEHENANLKTGLTASAQHYSLADSNRIKEAAKNSGNPIKPKMPDVSKVSFEQADNETNNKREWSDSNMESWIARHQHSAIFTDDDKSMYIGLNRMSNERLSENSQKMLLNNVTNEDYMKAATDKVDYNTLPAATESFNILAANPSTSSDNLHEMTRVAVKQHKNKNFGSQVFITDLVNHENLKEKDAYSLYRAYPKDTVKAKKCPKTIVESAVNNPDTPEDVRLAALSNPQLSKETVANMLKKTHNTDTTSAALMLNPNGAYIAAMKDNSYSRKPALGGMKGEDFSDEEIKAAEKAQTKIMSKAGEK